MEISRVRVREFRRQLRHLERIVDGHNKACCSSVSQAQCHVLLQVDDLAGCTVKDVAAALNLDTSTISRTVDGLVKLDLLKRTENQTDRRYKILRTTKKGKTLCKAINADADRYYGQVLRNIPSGERESVMQCFETIVRSMIKIEQDTSERNSTCNCGDSDA